MIRRRQRSQRRREAESQRRANKNLSCDHDLSPFVISSAIAAHNIKTGRPRIFFAIPPDLFLAFWFLAIPLVEKQAMTDKNIRMTVYMPKGAQRDG